MTLPHNFVYNASVAGGRPIVVLMVEDKIDDVDLTIEAFKEGKLRCNLCVVEDGIKALAFLHKKGKYADAHGLI